MGEVQHVRGSEGVVCDATWEVEIGGEGAARTPSCQHGVNRFDGRQDIGRGTPRVNR